MTLERLFRFSRFGGISEIPYWEETTMNTKWMWLLGAAIVAFVMGDVAKADHYRQRGYGYANYGYGNYGNGYHENIQRKGGLLRKIKRKLGIKRK